MTAQHPDPTTVEREDDAPECDLCGSATCPDADLPEFSEPRACAYAPIYQALRYDRCDYGCGRDITKATIRRDIVPHVARREREAAEDAWDEGHDACHRSGVQPWLNPYRAAALASGRGAAGEEAGT